MAKSIIKELIIVLLLCLAIIIILGILLYEYVPMVKTLPNQVSYTTPQEAKEELAEASEVDESQVVMTYEVNSADLNNYKKVNQEKQIHFHLMNNLQLEQIQQKMEAQVLATQIQEQVLMLQLKIVVVLILMEVQAQKIQQLQAESSSKIQEQNNLVINVISNIKV